MATIKIDGKQFEVDPTDNLLKVALSKGFDLPYFCWHPELHSVGACRQCAVKQYKNEDDTQGQIVMACMTAMTRRTRTASVAGESDEITATLEEVLEQIEEWKEKMEDGAYESGVEEEKV